MKNIFACLAIIVLSAWHAFAQVAPTTAFTRQAAKLKTFFDQHEMEKVYMHFDKPYYAASDTMYFKAYVVAGEKNALSTLSGVLNVELITPQNKIYKAIKLQLINGLAWGDIALPDSLPAGNYRARAYTRLMQNYGAEAFFERVFPIAAIMDVALNKKALEKKLLNNAAIMKEPDLQFLPEGGQLVPDVSARIAFKALRSDGMGIGASGVILNKANKVVAKFASTHLGMGAFNFTPRTAERYYAEVIFADSSKRRIALPVADSNTVALAVNTIAEKLEIAVNAGDGFFHANKNQPISLLFYSGGKLTTFTDNLTNRGMKFDLNKSRLASGVTQITLLNADGAPMCERLVFVDNKNSLSIGVQTDKAVYQTREHVTIKVRVQNPNPGEQQGHFSVAVIDKGKVNVNEDKEENILTYLLLSSCLKGNIENPGYYFNHANDEKRADLDLVMLTHGYRRFSWKALENNDVPPPTGEPEKNLSIPGLARSMGGTPINEGLVTLIPTAGGKLLSEKTDNTGAFNFTDLVFYDTTRFVLNAVNAEGGNNTQLVYKPQLAAPVDVVQYFASADTTSTDIIQAYVANSKNKRDQFFKYYGTGIQLKEVNVKAVKKPSYQTQSLAGAANADVLIKGSDLPRTGMLANLLSGRIGGVYFMEGDKPNGGVPKMQIGNGSPMTIIVDGVQRTEGPGMAFGINDIWPGDVESIEVLKYSKAAVYGVGGGNGVIIITTKRGVGVEAKDIVSRGVLPLTLVGYHKAREFYAPKYDLINNRTRPDLRSTIHWIPELMTDKNGDASFDLYNADGIGQYQIIIEGINNNGTAGVAKFTYEVKE